MEPHIERIEGQPTLVVPAGNGLPPKLDGLLGEMAAFGFAFREDISPAGARPACTVLREHRFRRFRDGRWFARSGPRRGQVLDLHVRMCADCGAVEVRDVSIDRLAGLVPGRAGFARRDHVLGFYSGKRVAGREYR